MCYNLLTLGLGYVKFFLGPPCDLRCAPLLYVEQWFPKSSDPRYLLKWSSNLHTSQYFLPRGPPNFSKWPPHRKSSETTVLECDVLFERPHSKSVFMDLAYVHIWDFGILGIFLTAFYDERRKLLLFLAFLPSNDMTLLRRFYVYELDGKIGSTFFIKFEIT